MHLKNMFKIQNTVDQKIRATQKIADDVNTTDLKIIAFKVEFGEFLNEHKFFKFWKVERIPNRYEPLITEKTTDENTLITHYYFKDPLLEEFADCVAFMLALALERKWDKFIHALDVVDIETKTMAARSIDIFNNPLDSAGKWLLCMVDLLELAKAMGITEEQIEEEYLKKSQINIGRQEEGY